MPVSTPLRALAALWLLAAPQALAETVLVVEAQVTDYKSIYGEVRSRKVSAARARISGTIASLNVRAGDSVAAGQTIATVGDPKIGLRIEALDAQISAIASEVENARTELERMSALFERRVVAKAALDRVQTAFDVISRQYDTLQAERRVLMEQLGEGAVLSPSAGRVLSVPAAIGGVVNPGETIAEIAEEDFILRLSMPERHARSIAVGEAVLIARDGLEGEGATLEGRVVLVYPDIAAGRVVADAEVEGLGDYFVGERIQAWLAVGARAAIVVPREMIETRFGVDFARIDAGGETPRQVVVRLGPPLRDKPGEVEVLSGLHVGDMLVRP
jgi:RND family efflux transporter MFP subunit